MSIYHFGPFRLDAPHLRLFRHDAEVFIKGLAFGILHKLAEHASAHPDAPFVSKDELQRSVWQGAFVSDEAIRSAVRHVRRALDDDTEHAHLLKTEKRLGWGLTVPVRKSTEASSTSPLQPPHLPYAPPFYVERPAEERALTGCAQYPGRPVFLCGPQGSGKDTLLSHVLDGAAKAVFPMPTRVVRVAFSTLQPVELVSFEACLFAIARKLLDELHVSPDAAHEMLRRHIARAVDPLLAFRRIARELFAHDPGITHLIFHDTETLACDPRHVPFFAAKLALHRRSLRTPHFSAQRRAASPVSCQRPFAVVDQDRPRFRRSAYRCPA